MPILYRKMVSLDKKIVREWVKHAKDNLRGAGIFETDPEYRDYIRSYVYYKRINFIREEEEKRIRDSAGRVH